MQKIPYIAALLTLAIHAAAYPVKFSFPKDAGEDQTSGLGRIHFFHSDPEQEKRDKEYQAKLERAEALIPLSGCALRVRMKSVTKAILTSKKNPRPCSASPN